MTTSTARTLFAALAAVLAPAAAQDAASGAAHERGTVVVRHGDDEIVIRLGNGAGKPRVEINGDAVDGDWKPATGELATSADGYEVRVTTPHGLGVVAWPDVTRSFWSQVGRRPHIGVQVGSLPPSLAEHLDLDPAQCVLVLSVTKDGPAAKAGLRAHDVLLGIDGEDEVTDATLRQAVAKKKPGDRMRVEVLRRGERKTLTVEVGEEQVPGYGTSPTAPQPFFWNPSLLPTPGGGDQRAQYVIGFGGQDGTTPYYNPTNLAQWQAYRALLPGAATATQEPKDDGATLESLQQQVRAIREQCEALLRQLERRDARTKR